MSRKSPERAGQSSGKVHIAYDPEADGLWVYRNGYIRNTVEVHPRILIDLGPGGKLMGIEIIDACKGMSPNELTDFKPRSINKKSPPTIQKERTYRAEADE